MWWKLNLKSRCFFIRYFIKGDVLHLYRYFIEGHVSLRFSWFIRKSRFIQNITEPNHNKSWYKCGKKWLFLKIFAMKSVIFLEMMFGYKFCLFKSINILLIFHQVCIYFKYCTPYPLWKLVKMWQKADAPRNICDGERYFRDMKEGCKISWIKIIF